MQVNVMAVADRGLGAAAGGAGGSGGGLTLACSPCCRWRRSLERRLLRALSRRRRRCGGGRSRPRAALAAGLDGVRLLGLRADHHVAVRAVEPHLGLGRRRHDRPRALGRPEVQMDRDRRRRDPPCRWTAEQHAESIQRDIDPALARGYRVVISDVWTWSADELAGQSAAPCPPPTARRRSTPCCTTTTTRSPPSAIPLPALTTS